MADLIDELIAKKPQIGWYVYVPMFHGEEPMPPLRIVCSTEEGCRKEAAKWGKGIEGIGREEYWEVSNGH